MDDLIECISLFLNPLDLAVRLVRGLEPSPMNDTPDTVYLVHHTPGRMRLRIPGRRNDTAFFVKVQTRMSQCAHVTWVEANSATAGVLVRYTGTLQELLVEATDAGMMEVFSWSLVEGLPPIAPLGQRLRTRLGAVDQMVTKTTQGQADATTLVLLFLLGAGVLQILRGQMLGSAVPLLWYAGQTLNGLLPTRAG